MADEGKQILPNKIPGNFSIVYQFYQWVILPWYTTTGKLIKIIGNHLKAINLDQVIFTGQSDNKLWPS